VGDEGKRALFAKTSALLFPIDWPEPFGLVMIEAMACGVPVIAFRAGSVPEIIEPGVTGFVVNTVDEAVAAVESISLIDRNRCRAEFERRFQASRMAAEYVTAYQRLIDARDFTADLSLSVA